MKVCLDVQAGIAQRAGIGRYTRTLARELGAIAGEHALRLFYFDFTRQAMPFDVPGAEIRAVRHVPGRFITYAWRKFREPAFDRFSGPADVFHFPNFILPPLRRGRAVVTIHDLSFLRYPEFAQERNRIYLTECIHGTAERADAIITDSQFSAGEIVAELGVPAGRVHAIHLGIEPAFQPAPPDAVTAMREALGLRRPYLLAVGTIEPRKNLPFLVDVFERMRSFDGDLVLAGMPGWKFEPIFERIERSSRRSAIRHVAYVDDALLPALYTGAECLVQPSYYEGFGFPPLEAMACGTPVISSSGGSLPEVLGDAAVIIDTFDVDRWVSELSRLLDDGSRLGSLIEAGRRQAARYRWETTAQKTWAVYESLVGGAPS